MTEYPRITIEDVNKLIDSKEFTAGKISNFLYNCFADKKNFDTFCYVCFPHAFPVNFAPFHLEIFEEFMQDKDSVVAAPRGHGKSTSIGLGYLTWRLLYKKNC